MFARRELEVLDRLRGARGRCSGWRPGWAMSCWRLPPCTTRSCSVPPGRSSWGRTRRGPAGRADVCAAVLERLYALYGFRAGTSGASPRASCGPTGLGRRLHTVSGALASALRPRPAACGGFETPRSTREGRVRATAWPSRASAALLAAHVGCHNFGAMLSGHFLMTACQSSFSSSTSTRSSMR